MLRRAPGLTPTCSEVETKKSRRVRFNACTSGQARVERGLYPLFPYAILHVVNLGYRFLVALGGAVAPRSGAT